MSDNPTPEPTPRLTRQEELRLLLADMTEFEPMNSVFGSAQLANEVVDDVSPERMEAWLEKEQARLREASGYDLRTEAEKRRDEEPTA
jgi:hypothetical protein